MSSDLFSDIYNNRHNPPEHSNQGDDGASFYGGSPFGAPTLPGSAFGPSDGGLGSSPFGGLGGNPFGDPAGGMGGMGASAAPDTRSTEDKVWDGVFAMAKGTGKGVKTFSKSFGDTRAGVLVRVGSGMIFTGATLSVICLVLSIISLFYPLHNLFSMLIGSILTTSIGFAVMGFFYSKAVEEADATPAEFPVTEEEPEESNPFEDSEPSVEADSFYSDDDDDDDGDGFGSFDADDDDDDDWLDSDDGDSTPANSDIDLEAAVEGIVEITPGTQTRSYLFEQYSRVLPGCTPGYSKWTEYDSEDDLMHTMEEYLIEAAKSVTTLNEEDEDDILITEMKENKYILSIEATKPTKLKPVETANELAKIYASRISPSEDGMPNDAIFARVNTSGSKMTINIFKGTDNVIVSLADAYADSKNWVLDTKNKQPVVLGVNEMGNLWKVDWRSLYSALISGMPRKGKSWETTSIVLQLAMYNSPRELNFYIGDTKGGTSDYYGMNIPHIKSFTHTVDSIIDMFDWIVNVEGERRKKVLGEAKCINWNDYIKKHPDGIDDMPETWVILDEMMGFKSNLDKDQNKEFDNYLKALVSQLPGMGIKFMGIPHRVINDVIPKNVYSIIPCKINVCGDPSQVQEGVGAKPSEFPYLLSNVGEMAMKVDGVNKGKYAYGRGIAMSDSNDKNSDIMEFIRTLWSKLEHGFYHGPQIDLLDKRNGVFDDYECGCKSHGGVKVLRGSSTPAAQGTASSSAGGLGRPLTGGYKTDSDSSYPSALSRLDSSDSLPVRDAMDDLGDDDEEDPLAGLFS